MERHSFWITTSPESAPSLHKHGALLGNAAHRRLFDSQTLDAGAIVAALEHDDRVHHIKLYDSSGSRLQRVLAAMQKPFPAPTDLTREFADRTPNVPHSFLGGSAPALRSLSLKYTPFPSPGLPKLLLSATNLVEVRLWRVPQSTYIPPEEIPTCLSALTRLKEFCLGFEGYIYMSP